MNPGILPQPSWEPPTTELWPPAQLDLCCQVKFQIHLEFHVTLTGIVLPWVSLGSPDQMLGLTKGDHGGLGGHMAGSPQVLCPRVQCPAPLEILLAHQL